MLSSLSGRSIRAPVAIRKRGTPARTAALRNMPPYQSGLPRGLRKQEV